MAPVPLQGEVRYIPLFLVGLHSATVIYLASTLSLSLYRLYTALRPAEGTRARVSRRLKLAPVFAGLALTSLVLAGYSSASYAKVSYEVWADQRGIEIPNSTFTNPRGNGARLYLSHWLSDTPIYREALEIVVEKARRYWWGQQIDLATMSWSLLLAIEGRRRNVPNLWAYMLLAHLVNLSFAQNLFYLALLLTPSPLPVKASSPPASLARLVERVFPTKPVNWCPHPGLFLTLLFANYVTVYVLPYAAETESFGSVVLLTRLLTFTPLVMPAIVPETWGTVHAHPHDAYGAYSGLFRFTSTVGFVLYAKATIVGLVYNLPGSHYHRHSFRIPFDMAERSNWERTTSAVGKLLGSTTDHPVVAGVGRDVLLSAVSLGLWAAIRAIDSNAILVSALPFYKDAAEKRSLVNAGGMVAGAVSAKAESLRSDASPAESTGKASTARRRRDASHKRVTSLSSLDGLDEKAGSPAASSKKRGRPRKIKAEPDEDPRDETYEPSLEETARVAEGDEVPAEGVDWEAAALAWGLAAAGGLGVASAGVFGAECISR